MSCDGARATVVAALIERDGRVLMARRACGLHESGLWELPGGKLEKGETPAEALSRELREELDIKARVEPGIFRRYSAASGNRVFDFIVLRAGFSGLPTMLGSHDALAWVAPGEIEGYACASLDGPALDAWKDSHSKRI